MNKNIDRKIIVCIVVKKKFNLVRYVIINIQYLLPIYTKKYAIVDNHKNKIYFFKKRILK